MKRYKMDQNNKSLIKSHLADSSHDKLHYTRNLAKLFIPIQ